MNRTILLILIPLLTLSISAATTKTRYPGPKCYIFRYTLTDKGPTSYSLDVPQHFLSQKSLERRQRQGLAIDSTDLPVSKHYVKLFTTRQTQVVGTSRWQQTIVVRSSDSLALARLAQLPIVREARCVFVAPDSIDRDDNIRWTLHREFNRWDSVKNDPYGMARPQIEMLQGQRLHEQGYRGKGITIAILDGGFQNYNQIPALQKARIAGTRDFVVTPSGFQAIDHGTKVFSALAAQAPEVIIGTAPDAIYWLMRCEDPQTEQPVEEDYWTMAAEAADSAGADIISSSLGYHAYDADHDSYRLQDLDGQTAFISRTASMLASKGIILCNSAGNSGMGQWKKIGVPADARDILTVGAVDRSSRLASFSSIGPSQDGRTKPDVVALGAPTALISGRGTLIHDMGTSFSTPIISGLVACLWQALPDRTALEIMDMVRQSANHYSSPTNILGYGVPDFWKAYTEGVKSCKRTTDGGGRMSESEK